MHEKALLLKTDQTLSVRGTPARMPAAVTLGVILLALGLPAAAETSAPFFGYFVEITGPFFAPGSGGSLPPTPRARSMPRLLRNPSHPHDVTGPGFVVSCYSSDGTVPDFAANVMTGSFLAAALAANPTTCSQESSFSQPLSLDTGLNPDGTGTGKISGSLASLSFSMEVAPQAYLNRIQVFIDFWYVQVFDSPVPPGSQLTFEYTIGGDSNLPTGITVLSDCAGCSAGAGLQSAGTHTYTVGPVTIGPSGTYTVIGNMGVIVDPLNFRLNYIASSYNGNINLGCALKAIPTPAAGQVPALGLPGNNWSFNYNVSDNDGLEVTNVMLGNRSMAAKMSVPYANITTTDFNGQHCLLEPDGSGNCASKLVYFQSGTNDVSATYVFTNIPEGTASCLAVTENFEFDPPQPGDMCEPSGNVGCARFYPTVSYQYLPDDDSKSVTEVDLPMRIQFTNSNPASNLLPNNQPQYAGIATNDNSTGLQDFFNGNPVQKEVFIPNVIQNGAPGAADSYYETYLPAIDSPLLNLTPDCPTCAQIHWRWSSIFAGVPGFGDDNDGEPRIQMDSTQSVDVALVAYPDRTQSSSCSNLAAGQQLAGVPTVFWYCGKGNQDSDTFFQHGGFFNPVSSDIATSSFGISASGFRVNHATGYWVQTVTLTNKNSTPVVGPVGLLLTGLTPGVTLVNADGFTQAVSPIGTPYVFATLDSFSELLPGYSLTLTLEFANPKNSTIKYTPQIYTGGLL